MEKYINGVRVYLYNNEWCCDFEDYKVTRIKQNKKWSEKSFCDWCDKYQLTAIG